MGYKRMMFRSKTIACIAAVCLAGCSSIIEGTSQTLSFESNPSGADCALERNGVAIGNVRTPGGIVVQKTKHNIRVTCKKDGYETATAHLKSEAAGATFGNIILGGGIGWAIDSSSGADNKYQEITTLTLAPLPSGTANVGPSATAERLTNLKKLFDDGLITADEHQRRREQILASQ
jgi:hypothetical protein